LHRVVGAAVVWLLAMQEAAAVDRSKFRTCEQGSFCRRFKKWIQRPDREKALWSLLPGMAPLPDGGYSFQVQHVHETQPHLILSLNTYASGSVRFRLNEIDPVHPRHVIPAGDVVTDPPPKAAATKVEQGAAATVFSFTSTAGANIKAELKHSPVGLDVYANGQLVQSLNAKNFLNFERYRKAKEDFPPDNGKPGEVVIDAAAHPHELDRNGLWEEDFGGHTDKKPRGPASLGMDVTFSGDVPALFGLPEHMVKASLPFYDEPYRFFNLDVFEYEDNEPMALYGAIPIIWAIHKFGADTLTSGLLWINPSETFVKLHRDEGSSTSGPAHAWFTSESGVLDVVVFAGPSPPSVSGQFHDVTGAAPMTGLWALGKHQCRWNYMSEKDVATVDASFDKHDLPYDVIWLDIEHTDGKKYFSWNPSNFPTPEKMTADLSAKRRKLVNVVDPHIKKDDGFDVFKGIRDQGFFVKKIDWRMMDDPTDVKPADWVEVAQIRDPTAVQPDVWNEADDGKWEAPMIDNPAYKGEWKAKQITDPSSPSSDFEGWCWPGTSGYPDFTDPKMRKFWGSQFALDKYKGTNADTYIWNDMNEPSVFNGPEVTMPRDAVHPNGNVEHRDVHNMYGYYVHRATFEGLAKRSPGDRPFVLTRSFFIGSHRYSAIWTGDNTAAWEHLERSVAMVGALTLGGQSLVGADMGGFFKHPDGEMTTRWYQLGTLMYPFLRNHAHLETPRREPYVYDEATMLRVKATLQMRYKMLPLWYTLYYQYHTEGAPVVRPLFWDFLHDPVTHNYPTAVESEISLCGVLVVRGIWKPMTEVGDSVDVILPTAAGWYSLYDGSFEQPGVHSVPVTMETIPAYYRAGAIIPLKSRMRRSSSCTWLDPFTLNVYLDPKQGTASGRLYIDDYKTNAYQINENFLDLEFEFKNGVLSTTSKKGKLAASVSTEVERIEIFGLSKPLASASLSSDGTQRELSVPVSRPLGGSAESKLFAAIVKVVPWLDIKREWTLTVS